MKLKGQYSFRLAIGQDIYDQLSPELKSEFADTSDKYGEFYTNGDEEMHMGEFTGDDFFNCNSDIMDLGGLSDEYWGEYDRLDDVNVYTRYLVARDFKKGVIPVSAFMKECGDPEGVKKYFYDLAEKIGKPEQVFLNGRQMRYRMDE